MLTIEKKFNNIGDDFLNAFKSDIKSIAVDQKYHYAIEQGDYSLKIRKKGNVFKATLVTPSFNNEIDRIKQTFVKCVSETYRHSLQPVFKTVLTAPFIINGDFCL